MRHCSWLLLLSVFGLACAREGRGAFSPSPAAYEPRAIESLRIPGGARCLELLDELHVKYARLPPKGGMATPVEIRGEIGGIRYTTGGRRTLVCDCRLALALEWSAPVLAAWNI